VSSLEVQKQKPFSGSSVD